MRIAKTPDLNSWNKLGTMSTSLGKEFILYESPDGDRIAQVDEDLMIHMIIKDGKPIYMNPKTMDALKRMAEIRKFLKEKARRPDL